MNFCGFFDVYNLYITQKKNFFRKNFSLLPDLSEGQFWKNFENFFQARGLRPVANDGEFWTLSCARVSSRLLKHFFSYFDLKIPFYKAKIENFFQGVCQKLSIPPKNHKIGQKLPLTYLGKVRKFQANQKNFRKKFSQKTGGWGHICPPLGKIGLSCYKQSR